MSPQLALPEGADGPVGPTTWTVHTPVFDGPLDLLLYLVKRDGVDVRELVVSGIADSYLAYLDRMRGLNLSIAADYLVMAATLVHLKSLELLPRRPTVIDEEAEDPGEALARQLEEYARYKAAAASLATRPRLGRDLFARDPLEVGSDAERWTTPVDAFGLLDLFYDLLVRSSAPDPVVAMDAPGPDFRACCDLVVRALERGNGRIELVGLLRGLRTRAERVITFVAVLEMVRLGWLDARQAAHAGPVEVEARVAYDRMDLDHVVGFVERPDPPADEPTPSAEA